MVTSVSNNMGTFNSVYNSTELSPYQRKKPKSLEKEPEALTTLLATGSLDLKQEPADEDAFGGDGMDTIIVLIFYFVYLTFFYFFITN